MYFWDELLAIRQCCKNYGHIAGYPAGVRESEQIAAQPFPQVV